MKTHVHKSLGSGILGITEVIDMDVSDVTQVAEPLFIVREDSEKLVNDEITTFTLWE